MWCNKFLQTSMGKIIGQYFAILKTFKRWLFLNLKFVRNFELWFYWKALDQDFEPFQRFKLTQYCQSIHCWNKNNWILSSFICGIHAWTNQLRDFLNAFVLLRLRHDIEQPKMTMGQYNVNNCPGIHGRRQK